MTLPVDHTMLTITRVQQRGSDRSLYLPGMFQCVNVIVAYIPGMFQCGNVIVAYNPGMFQCGNVVVRTTQVCFSVLIDSDVQPGYVSA